MLVVSVKVLSKVHLMRNEEVNDHRSLGHKALHEVTVTLVLVVGVTKERFEMESYC